MVVSPKHPYGPTRGAVYGLVILFISMVAFTFFNYWYTNYKIHQQCDFINAVNSAFTEHPPSAPSGVQLAHNVAKLKHRYDC
jgi:hypothetical protein